MKLDTSKRKKFRVSNKLKKVASKDRYRLSISRSLKNTGSDKQLVGEVASKIKTLRKIEPYKGKGVREKGQYILKKEGKKK